MTTNILRFLIPCLLSTLVACSNSTPPKNNVQIGPKKVQPKEASPFEAALKVFRYPDNPRPNDDWTRFRDGLQMLTTHFTQSGVLGRMNLPEDERAFLDKELKLSEDELAEVTAFSFRPADAHYLDECYLLRDVARSLDVPNMKPAQVADHYFRWVMRNVNLHQQVDAQTPPAFTLRRGHGNGMERALVCLSLLRQANLEGCLLIVPETDPMPVLLGVLIEEDKGTSLLLFDPRLGLPVRGPDGKSIATLKDVQADPKLLEPSLIDAKKLEAWLVCPLHALAPRMRELQRGLSEFDSIILHLNAPRLAKDIAAVSNGLPVKTWGTATRSLRQFLPKLEGGTDEHGRLVYYQDALLPSPRIKLNFAKIGIDPELMPDVAYKTLLGISYNLLIKYSLQTRELQLRGMYEPVVRRHERLQYFTRHEGLSNNPDFLKDLRAWQAAVRKATEFEDFSRGQKEAQGLILQDAFIGWLLDLDNERAFSRDMKRTVVTGLLAIGLEEYFDHTMAMDQGMRSHEKAIAAAAKQASKPKQTESAKKKLDEIWLHASTAWSTSYLDQVSLSDTIDKRLALVRLLDKAGRRNPLEEMHTRVGLLEDLHRELLQYFAAKLRLAETIAHLEGPERAQVYRTRIHTELSDLLKQQPLDTAIRTARVNLAALPANNAKTQHGPRTVWQNRIDLLASDWSERGALFWLQQRLKQEVGQK